jgi:hypothetical protein
LNFLPVALSPPLEPLEGATPEHFNVLCWRSDKVNIHSSLRRKESHHSSTCHLPRVPGCSQFTCCPQCRTVHGPYKWRRENTGGAPTIEMFCPLGPATLLTLGLLAKHVAAAGAPRHRSDPSVRLLCFITSSILTTPLKVSWGSCESFGINSTDSNLQCGSLDVPMDYHDNSAGTARLAVIKYSATAPNKLGTFFYNPGNPIYPSFIASHSFQKFPGGPGESGVEAISESGQAFSRAFQGAFGIVSWDPRGVGYTLWVHVAGSF